MAIGEDVSFHDHSVADNSLDGEAAVIDLGLHILNDHPCLTCQLVHN
jgi:hypothetical protein